MRTIPKKNINDLLNLNPSTSVMSLYIYLYFVADKDGFIRKDAFSLEDFKKVTGFSQRSFERAEWFLRRNGFLCKFNLAKYSRDDDDPLYGLEESNDISKGYINMSVFLFTDFHKLSKASKRFCLRLLMAEVTKHSLRLSKETLYKWSGINIKSGGILRYMLMEISPYFNFGYRNKICYFYKQNDDSIHHKISTDFNEKYKMELALYKKNIKLSSKDFENFYIIRKTVGREAFTKALKVLSIQRLHLIKNISAFFNSIIKKVLKLYYNSPRVMFAS